VKIPDSTRRSLDSRLSAHAREHWPDLAGVSLRFRSQFAYVDGQIVDGPTIPLCRLRYGGIASVWGFAIYRASHDDYEDSCLRNGIMGGSPEEALDCACGLYLADPRVWKLSFPAGSGGRW
jgi:hypothetical protein